MPLYRYQAMDRNGRPVVGAMQVPDEQALSQRLLSMGYQLMHVEAAPVSEKRAAAFASSAGGRASNASVSPEVVKRLHHQLATALRSGMPLYQALTSVSGHTPERPLREALESMALGVRDGHPLSGEMERYPRLFQRGDVGMVRAAEVGGFLPEAFAWLAARHEEECAARGRLRVWIWACHLGAANLALALAVSAFFYAGIANASFAAGIEAVRRAFLVRSLPFLVVYVGTALLVSRAYRMPRLLRAWHRFLLFWPETRKAQRLRARAVFLRTLEYLSRSAIPAGTAWEAAAAATPNLELAAQLAAATPTVQSTGRFSAGMQCVSLFDASDLSSIATGESAGAVPDTLEFLANRHEDAARAAFGEAVFRGSLRLVIWFFLFNGLALAALVQGYYGEIFRAVEKFAGIGG